MRFLGEIAWLSPNGGFSMIRHRAETGIINSNFREIATEIRSFPSEPEEK
jgi:hypothetical protein